MEGLRELLLDETSVGLLCPSISSLENLEILSLKQCKNLHSLPRRIHMRSLRTLNLSGCSNLYNFPEIPEVMNLFELNLDETAISELPSSIKNFTELVNLSLKDCRRLEILPGSIRMRSLQALNVSGCSNLKNFPEFLKVTENLTELHLDWTLVAKVSRSQKIVKFSGIAIEELPSIIYSLTGLATLTLRYSKDFKSLRSSICQLKSLNYLSLSGCTKFEVFPDILENMERLASLDLDSTSIRELPASIERLQGLVSLNLKNCKRLVYLPDSICNLLSLEWLTLHGCSKLSKLPEDLWYLKRLDINGTGIQGYRPEQRFITLGDLAQFRSTAPKIKAMVPNIEQNEAMADVESRLPSSSYVKEMRRYAFVEEMRRYAYAEGRWDTGQDIEEYTMWKRARIWILRSARIWILRSCNVERYVCTMERYVERSWRSAMWWKRARIRERLQQRQLEKMEETTSTLGRGQTLTFGAGVLPYKAWVIVLKGVILFKLICFHFPHRCGTANKFSHHILTDPEESSYLKEMMQRHLGEFRQRR